MTDRQAKHQAIRHVANMFDYYAYKGSFFKFKRVDRVTYFLDRAERKWWMSGFSADHIESLGTRVNVYDLVLLDMPL